LVIELTWLAFFARGMDGLFHRWDCFVGCNDSQEDVMVACDFKSSWYTQTHDADSARRGTEPETSRRPAAFSSPLLHFTGTISKTVLRHSSFTILQTFSMFSSVTCSGTTRTVTIFNRCFPTERPVFYPWHCHRILCQRISCISDTAFPESQAAHNCAVPSNLSLENCWRRLPRTTINACLERIHRATAAKLTRLPPKTAILEHLVGTKEWGGGGGGTLMHAVSDPSGEFGNFWLRHRTFRNNCKSH
jgi:hypothetical protein